MGIVEGIMDHKIFKLTYGHSQLLCVSHLRSYSDNKNNVLHGLLFLFFLYTLIKYITMW